ncbi:hypothetical protein BJY24_004533 [Nocardia transvalensis]|uniref:Uncharacterized protein n=1 Tax=Nocardia transvalensis TaxID=37333 RepID=A0A7W9PGJ8_9NOCA|nr:hypothetical protein [Nocardia transvalensis]MBB5915621.1 hypothetical protein [Nocardia transvalensis]
MDHTLRIGQHPYLLVGKAPLSTVSRACYGKNRYTLQRVSDGSLWQAFGYRLTAASEVVRCEFGRG